MNNNGTFLSIIVPCRNEADHIDSCLESIIANDFPAGRLEVLVVDGMSEDSTREVVREYAKKYPYVRLLDNPKRSTSDALNRGITKSRGRLITILSSHAQIEVNFIKRNIANLKRHQVDCVGGVMSTVPANGSPIARAIAIALTHPFGVGNASFRIGSQKPRFVDTVPFGCYTRQVFERVGYFDENLVRNQDIEFNLRLRRAGGKILLSPDIKSYYHARSNLSDLFKQNFGNGFWVIYSLLFAQTAFSWRHLIPLIFVLALTGSLVSTLLHASFSYLFLGITGLYSSVNIICSFQVSLKRRFKHFWLLIPTFFTLHVSYGIGSLLGLLKTVYAYISGLRLRSNGDRKSSRRHPSSTPKRAGQMACGESLTP